ncbi:MAG TPA: methyltransferase domain-containing protein [Gemmatimonadales bacterium]|nr:methyltransferase domain-containing protein [Gemmatimonadales bacterium]
MSAEREFDARYYASEADTLGWGASHAPDEFKLGILREHVIGEPVLDLACGPCTYAAALAAGGRRVTAVDFSLDLLRSASSAAVRRVAASGLALPFRDRSMETTLLLSVLEHVDDRALLAEATRVTGRRLIVQVPLEEPPLLREAGVLFSHWTDRSHLRLYSERSITALLAGAGWRLVAFIPAYRRDLQERFVRGLRAPEPVRNLVRLMLKPLRSRSPRPAAEAFVVADRAEP